MFINWGNTTDGERAAMERRRRLVEEESRAQFMQRLRTAGSAGAGSGEGRFKLRLTFTSASAADQLVGDATWLASWNSLLELPSNGPEFEMVRVLDNQVILSRNTQTSISIEESALWLNVDLVEVVDEGGLVTQIGANAFNGCTSLTKAHFPACTNANFAPPPGGSGAFNGCTALTDLHLPLVTAIGSAFLRNCSALSSLSLPSLVTTGSNAFVGMSQLSTISAPLLTTVGVTAFQGCSSLTSINLPSLTTLPFGTFTGCSALASVTFAGLTTITGSGPFSQCTALATVTMPALTTIASGTQQTFVAAANTSNLVQEYNFPSLTTIAATVAFRYSAARSFIMRACTSVATGTFRDSAYVGTVGSPRVYDLRACTDLGGSPTTGQQIWAVASSTTIGQGGVTTLYIDASRLTCNAGGPDPDIGSSQATVGSLRRSSTNPLTINP